MKIITIYIPSSVNVYLSAIFLLSILLIVLIVLTVGVKKEISKRKHIELP